MKFNNKLWELGKKNKLNTKHGRLAHTNLIARLLCPSGCISRPVRAVGGYPIQIVLIRYPILQPWQPS